MTELLLARRGTKKEEVPTIPGTPWQGGFYAGLIRVGSDIYALVVAPKSAESTLAWKTANTSTPGATSLTDGRANTMAMVAAGVDLHPAAKHCVNYRGGGHDDWYLPSFRELVVCYWNFKPNNTGNTTSVGSNPDSLPTTQNYTAGSPSISGAVDFQAGNPQAFNDAFGGAYWSSLAQTTAEAYVNHFNTGDAYEATKTSSLTVRPVRRVKIEIPDPPASIGEPYEGGFYAGRIWHPAGLSALVVAPKALGGEAPRVWKTSDTTTVGTDSISDGWANTQAMATAGLANHPAAQFCRGLSIGGFNDWYLPSKDELEILYRNFKPTTTSNNTSFGANSNAVPPTGNYTSGNPSQTSTALFKQGAAEAFQASSYRSSTQYSPSHSWGQSFINGSQSGTTKTIASYVRAVRRVPQPIYVAKN